MNTQTCQLNHAVRTSLFALIVGGTAWTQTLGPDFINDYTVDHLAAVPGVVGGYGGVVFKDVDPNKLVIVGDSALTSATLYEVGVTRDAAGHVDGFAGTATVIASAPNADGGLRYGPGAVLLYTSWPDNTLGQIKPGSVVPDKVIDLSALGVISSTGGLGVTPAGFPGAGSLKITSYDGNFWYDADLVPDGMGTFDLANLVGVLALPPYGSESVLYVDSSYPAFANQSVLVAEYNIFYVGAYEIEAAGDPLTGSRRDFLSSGASFFFSGSALDPVTGDFLFADALGLDVVVVRPNPPPVGTNYCISTVNSTGFASTMSSTGSASISASDLVLSADNLPSQPGIFIAGPGQAQIPFFNGFLCIDPGGLQRFLNTASPTAGVITEAVDYATSAAGGLNVVAGSAYNYQRWNRDPAGGGGNANFSDGYQVIHTP